MSEKKLKLKTRISSNFFYIYPKEKHPSDVSSKKYLKFLFQIFYEVEWIFLIQLTRTSAQILFCFEAVCFDIFFPTNHVTALIKTVEGQEPSSLRAGSFMLAMKRDCRRHLAEHFWSCSPSLEMRGSSICCNRNEIDIISCKINNVEISAFLNS